MTQGDALVSAWYSVRTVYLLPRSKKKLYEERITVWRATSMAEAIELAEVEARDYEGEPDVDGRATGPKYLGLAQGYAMANESDSVSSADEIFSLVRGSTLKPKAYLDAFFDTGSERQTKFKPRSKKNKEKRSSRPEQIDCSASPPFDKDRMTFRIRAALPVGIWP